MKRKINSRLIETAALAILATLLLMTAVCYHILSEQVMKDLKSYADIADYAVRYDQQAFFEEEAELLKEDRVRITLIADDGTVLADTQADPAGMGNHLSRPEIQSARQNGSGSIIRQSDTLGENTFYYAKRMENGQILRVSRDTDSIYRIVDRAMPKLMILIAGIFAVCCISAYFLSESLIRPIKQIARDVDHIDQMEVYEELIPYIEAIKGQHEDVLQNARMRQEFTANVSHELKTPLAAISGYSELIQNGMASSEQEICRFAGEIHSNADRLLTLINDVIRLSELDGEEMQETLEQVNLREVAENCVNMLRVSAEKHEVTIDFQGENAVILATRQMTEEVLYNLCDNAIRYNRPGGSVHVAVKDRLDQAVLVVQDTGIGIPKEHQERIFERFYRVDKGRSKSTGGTGLGLAIVKHILLKLDAEVSLESEEGKGTKITVTFPALREARFK